MKLLSIILLIVVGLLYYKKMLTKIWLGMKNGFESFTNFLNERKSLAITASIIAFGTYIYEITNFTLSIDEELMILNPQRFVLWITQGRSGTFVFDKLLLLNNKFTPSLSTFVSIVLLVVSVLFFMYFMFSLSKKKLSNVSMVLSSGCIITLPIVNPDYISFSIYNIEVTLGILLALFSVSMIFKYINYIAIKHLLVESVILAIALLIYQSLATVYITVFVLSLIIYTMYNDIGWNKLLKMVFHGVGVMIISLILYMTINKMMELTYSLSASYIDSFIGWGKGASLLEDLRITIQTILNITSGKYYPGTEFLSFYYTLFLVSVLYLIMTRKMKMISLALLICLLIAPFSLSLFMGSNTIPIRTLQALPIWCGSVVLLSDLSFKQKDNLFRIATVFICLVIFLQMQLSVNLYVGDHLRYESDKQLSYNIMMEVEKDANYSSDKSIVFVGRIRNTNPNVIRRETIGASFYEWDEGNNRRIHALINYLGYNIKYPEIDEIKFAKETSTTMPSWPKEGSILQINNMYIVKLSEPEAFWDIANGIQ